jgi:hypothetical protein
MISLARAKGTSGIAQRKRWLRIYLLDIIDVFLGNHETSDNIL